MKKMKKMSREGEPCKWIISEEAESRDQGADDHGHGTESPEWEFPDDGKRQVNKYPAWSQQAASRLRSSKI